MLNRLEHRGTNQKQNKNRKDAESVVSCLRTDENKQTQTSYARKQNTNASDLGGFLCFKCQFFSEKQNINTQANRHMLTHTNTHTHARNKNTQRENTRKVTRMHTHNYTDRSRHCSAFRESTGSRIGFEISESTAYLLEKQNGAPGAAN